MAPTNKRTRASFEQSDGWMMDEPKHGRFSTFHLEVRAGPATSAQGMWSGIQGRTTDTTASRITLETPVAYTEQEILRHVDTWNCACAQDAMSIDSIRGLGTQTADAACEEAEDHDAAAIRSTRLLLSHMRAMGLRRSRRQAGESNGAERMLTLERMIRTQEFILGRLRHGVMLPGCNGRI